MNNIIKQIRKEKGFSQQEFATVAGVSSQTIFDIEHFNRKTINDNILKIIEQLGYDQEKLKKTYNDQRQQKQKEMLQQVK
jgi:transcriptional regulator with XRE-family HTH domain